MNQQAYRIYLRTSFPFLVTLSVGFMAVLCAIAFVDTEDSSRLALVLPTAVLFTLAYFLHRASLSWIQISEDGMEIVSVPSWYSRRLWGEDRVVGRIVPGSELLFCRKSAYGAFDGYYIILRTPSAPDQVLWNAESGINRRVWERVANETRDLHLLNAHLVRQVVSDQGMKETDWTAESDKLPWKNLRLVMGPALFPWLGIAVRLFTANTLNIALVGAFLWVIGISALWYFYRRHHVAKEQGLVATALIWTVQFVGFYTVIVLATGAFLHR